MKVQRIPCCLQMQQLARLCDRRAVLLSLSSTLFKPNSVMEHVASSGTPLAARPSTQFATRGWNSCSNRASASRAFTSNRYLTENWQGLRALARSSAWQPLDRRLKPAVRSYPVPNDSRVPRPSSSRSKDDVLPFDSGLQRIARLQSQFAPDIAGDDDLPLG